MNLRLLKEQERLLVITQLVNLNSWNNHNVLLTYIFLEKSIGEGTFGKVKLGTHHITGEKVS